MSQTNINQTIEKLLIIQERDVRIMRCQREIDQIPKKKQEIETETGRIRDQTQQAKNDFKTRQSEIKKIELETDALRQKIGKLREQQLQIKSNEEYRALNNEITGLTEEIKKMEEREIGVMEQADNAQRKELSDQKSLTELENTIKKRLHELDEHKANLEHEVQRLESDRETIAKDIANEYLVVYNRIIENKKDKALVAAENSICTGCHMRLQAQVICDLKKSAGLMTCSFCGRLLYLVH